MENILIRKQIKYSLMKWTRILFILNNKDLYSSYTLQEIYNMFSKNCSFCRTSIKALNEEYDYNSEHISYSRENMCDYCFLDKRLCKKISKMDEIITISKLLSETKEIIKSIKEVM